MKVLYMERLPADLEQWPVAVGGKDPREFASPELGEKAIALQVERMSGILNNLLVELDN